MEDQMTAVISGGTSGIGLAAAACLAREGWRTVLLGRDEEKGRRAAASVQGSRFLPCDVGDSAAVTEAVRLAADGGPIGAAVAAVGVYTEGLLENTTDGDIAACLRTNVCGTLYFLRACIPYMKARGGSIVTVASDAALQGNVQTALYGASKGAVLALSRSLALELSVYGIRVNCVCPGDIRTPLLAAQLARYGGTEADMAASYPLGRIGEPEEVGEAVAFLISRRASFITGAALPVDGGLTDW